MDHLYSVHCVRLSAGLLTSCTNMPMYTAQVGLMYFLTMFSAAPQYVVETKFVGEQAVQGAPTEVVGNESKIVDEHIKQAPAGDRTVVVENVDVPASEVCSQQIET
jgi:hypothetical protein